VKFAHQAADLDELAPMVACRKRMAARQSDQSSKSAKVKSTVADKQRARACVRMIHSGDSQNIRSSSSSRYESRNCGECHAGRSPSA
jgi:hypothetical protein